MILQCFNIPSIIKGNKFFTLVLPEAFSVTRPPNGVQQPLPFGGRLTETFI